MKKAIPFNRRAMSKGSSAVLTVLMLLSLTLNPIAATRSQSARAASSSPVSEPSAILSPTAAFTNAAAISIPDNPGVPALYPSNIAVSGMVGPISTVSVTLNGLSAPRPSNLDFLLVGPGGQNLLILSDAGANLAAVGPINLTLDDAAGGVVPSNPTNPTTGSYRPTDYDLADAAFPAPAPAIANRPAPSGTATFTSVFGGLSGASVNGNWSLYAIDDAGGGGASSVAGGWTLNITTTAAAATTTAISSSANPSFRQNAVTFTATVTSTSTVNTGTVTFTDGATTLCATVAVNGSGVAQCTAPANTLTEGQHTITATYNGNVTFATSNASLVQTVNNQTQVVGSSYTNPGTITIADNLGGASAVPYPSNIFVSGLSGTISKVTLTLTNFNAPRTSDVDFLLVGPNGDTYVFMSDAGGSGVATAGATLTFDDAAAIQVPNSGSLSTGTFRPADYALDSDTFPAPAPAGPYNSAPPNGVSTFASVFGGDAPNGTWSLYADDDAGGGGVSTVAGWTLTFTTSGDAVTTTTVTSSPNPSNVNQAVTFTATVASGGSPVTVGNVTFRRGAAVLCANVALNASGQAACTPAAATFNMEGVFTITADYNGAPGQFNISSGSVTQTVTSPTIVSCLNFANNGGIAISNATQQGNPYPSNIIVSGLGGSISKLTLTMNIGNAPTPDHTDFLLVGPNGERFIFMSDAGGTTDIVGQTLTFDDAAATALPDSTSIVSGTYRPASYAGDSDNFPSPAPAGPYNPAAPEGAGTFASVFNGTNPNGTWSLYAVEDAGDAADTIINSWSLSFTLAATATTTTVTSSANPSVFGQPVTFTAAVSSGGFGTPTGNVQFFNGATPIGAPVALNGSGTAQITTSALAVGSHSISAQYAGASGVCTGTFNASSGSLAGNPQVVNQSGTTTSVASSANPAGTGLPVTFTATVSPSAPGAGTRTGTVTFFRNGDAVCSNVAITGSGQATCLLSFSVAGNYNITAQYSGDANFTSSTSPTLVQNVFGPTAAEVFVTGRVVTNDGRGIASARVSITDSAGYERVVIANPFGYYRISDVRAGSSYVIAVSAKGYTFEPSTIVRLIADDAANVDFIGSR